MQTVLFVFNKGVDTRTVDSVRLRLAGTKSHRFLINNVGVGTTKGPDVPQYYDFSAREVFPWCFNNDGLKKT